MVAVDPAASWQHTFRQAVSLCRRYQKPTAQDTLLLILDGVSLTMSFADTFAMCPELEGALKELEGVVGVEMITAPAGNPD